MQYRVLAEKLKEAAASVLPVTAIVAVLCLALVRVDVGLMLSFLLGSGLLIVGMGLFTLGADTAMTPPLPRRYSSRSCLTEPLLPRSVMGVRQLAEISRPA